MKRPAERVPAPGKHATARKNWISRAAGASPQTMPQLDVVSHWPGVWALGDCVSVPEMLEHSESRQ
jgi:hypothetical protein